MLILHTNYLLSQFIKNTNELRHTDEIQDFSHICTDSTYNGLDLVQILKSLQKL